ncbi:hypothetical protein HMPREF1557_00937 [Streptococcus sobrinus W1703]|uniref:Uncharacterized protein n=1 Tax=Streptococcus sobrinus W1703 TaxID=1227275 RepID=U2J9R4_9STRE|nr:hypothetical protein HMPREF1557_00937 [Streptococcus sobrinus W1703]
MKLPSFQEIIRWIISSCVRTFKRHFLFKIDIILKRKLVR